MAQDPRPGLPTIRTATVIARGTADARSPRNPSLELCELLPQAHLVEIAGAGHVYTGPELDAVLVAASREARATAEPPTGRLRADQAESRRPAEPAGGPGYGA